MEAFRLINAIVGGLGSGKTLLMIFLLYLEKKAGKYVVTNMSSVDFQDEVLDFNAFLQDVQENASLNNIALGLDEIHILLDSRSSMSKSSKIASYFILQTRKRNVNLYCTSQHIGQVDLRLRNMLDRVYICENVKDEKGNKTDLFQYRLIDYTETIPRKHTFFLDGREIYGLYDTAEIINVFESRMESEQGNKR